MIEIKSALRSIRERLLTTKAEGYIDTAVKLIIGAVIGALLMVGLYAAFNSVLLPGMADHLQGMV